MPSMWSASTCCLQKPGGAVVHLAAAVEPAEMDRGAVPDHYFHTDGMVSDFGGNQQTTRTRVVLRRGGIAIARQLVRPPPPRLQLLRIQGKPGPSPDDAATRTHCSCRLTSRQVMAMIALYSRSSISCCNVSATTVKVIIQI